MQTENKALQSAHRSRSTSTTPATDFLITARIDQVGYADAGAPLLRPERSEFPEITLPVTHVEADLEDALRDGAILFKNS